MKPYALALMLAILGAGSLGAQAWTQQRPPDRSVPEGHRPPPGMCRIWIDGVPPGQQPAPTDCATAVRNRPSNGRVIWGEDPATRRDRAKPQKGKPGWDDDRDDRRVDRRVDRRNELDDDVDLDGLDADDLDARDREILERDRRAARGGDRSGEDGRYRRPFRPGSDICDDRNRDGVCDDAQRGGEVCVDRDRDGVCDAAYAGSAGGVGALPDMRSAADYRRGQRDADVLRWLGDQQVTVRTVDADRDGIPDRVSWLGLDGQVVQAWRDRDHDGIADVVEFFRDGRVVQVVGQQ
jgi:hypothetical protein